MTGPGDLPRGNSGPEDSAGRRRGGAELPLPEGVTREQMAAYVNAHSGLPEVALQEWAILLRCKGAAAVALDELVESLIQWFDQPLSAPEIGAFLDRLVQQGWLTRLEQGHAWHTTPLGEAVLAQTERPLLKGTAWSLIGRSHKRDQP